MDPKKSIEYCILNVAANPHPEGTYRKLLDRAAMKRVNYWGAHYATISAPRETESGFLQGRLVTWVEIDRDEPAVLLDELSPVDFNDLDLNIPTNVGFNGRVFLYTFRERDHLLFIEILNEFGKRLSAGMAQKIFRKLFDNEVQGSDAPLVEVTVIPEEDALNRVLKIPRLKRLKIHIVRPNADDIDADQILAELEAQGARSQDILLVASPQQDGLNPNGRTRTQAEVAEHNGYVEGMGEDEDGSKVTYSTRAYPRIIRRILGELGGFIDLALMVAKETVVRDPRR